MSEVACDFLLFVATPTEYEELELVASEMGLEWESRKSAIGKFRYLGVLGGARVVAVRTDIGPVGVRGSTRTANFYLAATQAQGLVCLGMAFGISRELQKPGTVLVSESMFPYDRRTVVGDHGTGWRYEYDSRSTVHRASSVLVDLMRRHHVNVSRPHAVEFGCLLSGSARIQCARYRDALVAQALPVAPGIVGGEMEGVGLLSIEPDDARWVLVKGIADFADEVQTLDVEENRRLACRNAATFVLEALRGQKGPA